MDKEKIQYIQNWLIKADNDLKVGEIVLESDEEQKPFDTVCFHCQQAVEKWLKAYLIYLDVMFPRTHSAAQLIEIGSMLDQNLKQLENAELLTIYAVETRYPEDFYMPNEEEAREAFDLALQVRKYILSKINF
jgi:HEPN domain-containing protein